jgi:glutamyl-tRNA synthetase
VPAPVRVRFAPSPTGHLHVGGARTAIYNWAFARRSGGTFVLRIDDTDPERSTDENVQAIFRGLRWLGLDWDEGPETDGHHGPYFQTQRMDTYLEAISALSASGHAYPCFCTAEDLDARRGEARTRGGFAGYDRRCRSIEAATAAERVAAGEPHVWRLAVPGSRAEVSFDDAIRGTLTFPAADLDDFVLLRTDGTPTYNFASVIDDALMEITHVVRGDDHLSNTPRQILLFEALGHAVPVFAHLPMILGPDGKRLSKRHGATSVEAFRDEGFLPEAVLNYLALLGWSLDGETTVVSADTLAANFSFDRVSRNPAIFDTDKLEWLNGVYIREMGAERFAEVMGPRLVAAGLLADADLASEHDRLAALAPLVSERVKRLDEIAPTVRFLFVEEVPIDSAAREKVLGVAGVADVLRECARAIEDIGDFGHASIEAALRTVPESLGVKPKAVFQTLRVAVTGSTVSLPLFESLELLGRERTLARIDAALLATVDDPAPQP